MDDAACDEYVHVGSKSAGERSKRKDSHAVEKDALAAEPVSEPPGDDQPDSVGERVAADDELDAGKSGLQTALDCGRCYIDDKDIGRGEKDGKHHDRKQKPRSRFGSGKPGAGFERCWTNGG